MAFFFGILEGVKDAIGSAWCTGSGYALRRTALDQIGGFPTGSVAEDVFCSNLLLGAGWRTCYVQEPLQYGTVPDSFSGHIKQRARWVSLHNPNIRSFSIPADQDQTIGTVQTSAKLNFFLFGRICRGMSVLHRFTGFVFTLGTLSTVSAMGSLLMFPIVLVSGFRLVAYADNDQLRWLLRLAFFSLAINRVNEWVAFVPAGYRFAWRGNLNTLWMAPCQYSLLIQHPSFTCNHSFTDNSVLCRSRGCNRPLIPPPRLSRRKTRHLLLIRQHRLRHQWTRCPQPCPPDAPHKGNLVERRSFHPPLLCVLLCRCRRSLYRSRIYNNPRYLPRSLILHPHPCRLASIGLACRFGVLYDSHQICSKPAFDAWSWGFAAEGQGYGNCASDRRCEAVEVGQD